MTNKNTQVILSIDEYNQLIEAKEELKNIKNNKFRTVCVVRQYKGWGLDYNMREYCFAEKDKSKLQALLNEDISKLQEYMKTIQTHNDLKDEISKMEKKSIQLSRDLHYEFCKNVEKIKEKHTPCAFCTVRNFFN